MNYRLGVLAGMIFPMPFTAMRSTHQGIMILIERTAKCLTSIFQQTVESEMYSVVRRLVDFLAHYSNWRRAFDSPAPWHHVLVGISHGISHRKDDEASIGRVRLETFLIILVSSSVSPAESPPAKHLDSLCCFAELVYPPYRARIQQASHHRWCVGSRHNRVMSFYFHGSTI
jgi:hypothetical protein